MHHIFMEHLIALYKFIINKNPKIQPNYALKIFSRIFYIYKSSYLDS